jgi:hypothetical protein
MIHRLALTFFVLLAAPLTAQPPAEPRVQPARTPAPAPDPAPELGPLTIAGPDTVAPYKIVRLSAKNVPAKAGVMWKVRAVAATDSSTLIDWASRQNVQEVGFVAPPGQYRAELSVGSVGTDGTLALDYAEKLVTIGAAPLPPPGPGPGPGPSPGPGPTPGPAPIAGDGLRVLVVFESAKLTTYPPGQLAALYSKSVRDYLGAKCAVGPDGKTPERRFYDADVDLSQETKTWQDAMKRPRTALPWVVVSNPAKGGGYEGPLPASAEEFLALLKKWGD